MPYESVPTVDAVSPQRPGAGIFRFDGFELDSGTLELRRDGEPVSLQPQPAQVLGVLLERAGALVTRRELEDVLWTRDTHVDREQGLNYCIHQIRLALGDSGQNPRYIETLPRRGYRFLGEVRREDAPKPKVGRGSRRWWWAMIAAAGLVLVLGIASLELVGFSEGDRAGGELSPHAQLVDPDRRLLAVIPLENRGADDFLVAGLTEELGGSLAAIDPRKLGVIAQSAVERHLDLDGDEIGKALAVDYLLEGSVRRSGERIAVSLRLVQVGDLTQRWAETYDLAARDAFRVEQEVVRDVAHALSLRPPAEREAGDGGTSSPEAFEAFLQGIHLLRRSPPHPDPVPYFERAVEIDPGYARAWAYLADAYRQRPFDPENLVLSREASHRALEIDPRSANAHLELGLLALYYDFDVAAAEVHLEQALRLQPSFAHTYHHYGAVLAIRGDHGEALENIRRALVLDPGSLTVQADLGWFALFARDYEAAVRNLVATLDVSATSADYWPRRALLGTYVVKGAWEEAAELATTWPEGSLAGTAVDPVPGDPRATVESFLRREISDLRDRFESFLVAPSTLAVNYALLNEPAEAVRWLRLSAEIGWGWQVPFLRIDPRFDALREDADFQAFLDDLGLPEPASPDPTGPVNG